MCILRHWGGGHTRLSIKPRPSLIEIHFLLWLFTDIAQKPPLPPCGRNPKHNVLWVCCLSEVTLRIVEGKGGVGRIERGLIALCVKEVYTFDTNKILWPNR